MDVDKAKPTRDDGDHDGPGEKKGSRKLAAKKQVKSSVDMESNQQESNGDQRSEVLTPTPKKRGRKVKKVESEGESGYADVEDAAGPTTPKPTSVKKRTPKPKKESVDGDTSLTLSNSAKKRTSLGGIGQHEDGTPSKKPRANYPKTHAELTEADKLMMDLKKQGKTWAQITTAVSTLTGLQYGKSTIGNRYLKIVDALTEWKDGDIERMLFVRQKAEQEIETAVAAFKKDAENKIWSSMAKAMVEIGADEYTAGAVEKAYNREKKQGFPHRDTVAAVMAAFSSASGVKADGASDGEDEAEETTEGDGANELEDLQIKEDMEDEN